MHPTTLLLAALLPSALAANFNSPLRLSLLKRQDVGTCSDSNYVVCGNNCMPSGDNCCNADGDYCPSDESCGIGDNGVVGCCPTGESCTGDGGTQTVPGATLIGSAATSSFTSLPSGGAEQTAAQTTEQTAAQTTVQTAAQTTALGSSLSLDTTFPSSTATLGGGGSGSTTTGSAAPANSAGAAASAFVRDPSLWTLLLVAAGNMLL